MGNICRYAQVVEAVLSVKKDAAPVVMKDKVFPVVSEDESIGTITVLAEGRKILLERQFVRILSETEADALEVMV